MVDDLVFSEIGGHPAVDLVNTCPFRRTGRFEQFVRFEDVLRWAVQNGIVAQPTFVRLAAKRHLSAAKLALSHILALREALREVFASKRAPEKIDIAVALCTGALQRWRGHLALTHDGSLLQLDFSAIVETPADVVAAIARSAAELLVSDEMARVKHCEADRCVMWFIDKTRNGSRHWCRMDRCGSRMKMAAYSRRRREGRSAGPSPSKFG